MSAIEPLPPTKEGDAAAAPDAPIPDPLIQPPKKSRSGMLSILIVALTAVTAWYFFTNLFTHRPGTTLPMPSVALAPTPPPKAPEALFVPNESQSPPPEIKLPVMDTPEVEASKRAADAAIEIPTEVATPPQRKSGRMRLPGNAQRSSEKKSTLRSSSITQDAKPLAPSPQISEPAPAATLENSTAATSVDTTNRRQEAETEAPQANSPSVREARTTITRYADTTADTNSAPVDFASISAGKPVQEPPAKKPLLRNSGLVVIVNKANSKTLARSDISNIYRDRITRWPTGERILVLNLPLDSGERRRFSTAVLEMSPLDAATESSNRAITNRVQNEYRTKNADVVVSYIERNPNAIGYVPAAAITDNDNVRVVYTIP